MLRPEKVVLCFGGVSFCLVGLPKPQQVCRVLLIRLIKLCDGCVVVLFSESNPAC